MRDTLTQNEKSIRGAENDDHAFPHRGDPQKVPVSEAANQEEEHGSVPEDAKQQVHERLVLRELLQVRVGENLRTGHEEHVQQRHPLVSEAFFISWERSTDVLHVLQRDLLGRLHGHGSRVLLRATPKRVHRFTETRGL